MKGFEPSIFSMARRRDSRYATPAKHEQAAFLHPACSFVNPGLSHLSPNADRMWSLAVWRFCNSMVLAGAGEALISLCVRAAAAKPLMKNSKLTILVTFLSFLSAAAHAADTYQVDPVHSSMLFKIRHLNVADFYGFFDDVSGTVSLDPANAAGSSLNLEVKTDSIDTRNPKRNQDLKGPDFFNVKQFPTITFKSTKVENAGADAYRVTGNLTLRGVTKPLALEFKKTGEGKGMKDEYRAGGEAQFTIKRSDFGMSYMQGVLGDEVTLIISLEGIKK